ncbi:MAG: AbrB family transcriptional regulator [Methylorubrum populi]
MQLEVKKIDKLDGRDPTEGSPHGGVRLTPYDPEFDRAMSVVDEVMDEYRDTLRALAK